jgi:hypothetical protein
MRIKKNASQQLLRMLTRASSGVLEKKEDKGKAKKK